MKHSFFIQFSLVLLLASNFNYSAYSQFERDKKNELTLKGIEALSATELLAKGVRAMEVGEYSLSRTYLDYAVVKAIGSDSIKQGILATNNIGNLYYYLNEPDSALYYYYQALDWAEKENSLAIQNTLNNNISIIYASTNHPLEARAVMEKALANSILLHDSSKIATNLINLSSQEVNIGNTVVAQVHLNRAKKILEELGSDQGLLAIYVNLGNIQYSDSNYNEALNYFILANTSIKEIHLLDKINVEINIGRTYIALKNYDSALIHLKTAEQLAIESNNIQSLSNTLGWVAICKREMRQFEAANDLYVQIIDIKDSLILLEKNDWIQQSRNKHQFELKQKEFELVSQNTKKRNALMRVLFAGLLIIIILLVVILRMRVISSKQKEKLHQEENKRNTEKLQKAKSKNNELKQTIETINYELVSKTLLIDNKNQILESIGSVVKDAERLETSAHLNEQVSQLKQQLLRDQNVEQNWEDFKIYFERVNTDFFKRIHIAYPNLTSNDMRLMAFLLLEFNSKEIAQILNITPSSVRKRKQRLKEKLNIAKDENLLNHLYTFTS